MYKKTSSGICSTANFRECIMKLPIIAASILAYAVLATMWICYNELVLQ